VGRRLRVPALICINKADLYPEGAWAIEALGTARGVATIARLPFDLSVAEALAAGRPVTATHPGAPVSLALAELWTVLQARPSVGDSGAIYLNQPVGVTQEP